LGKTLETLQPSQMEEIVTKLSEKGYNVNTDRILSRRGEIYSIILSGVIWAVLCMVVTI
jgi:tRNA A22 N-methylase